MAKLEQKDAVMPHGYGWKYTALQEKTFLEQAKKGNSKTTIYAVSEPSEIGEFGVDAAVALDAKNYLSAGDSFWGHLLTSAEIYVNAIKRKIKDKNTPVINAGGARTTSMEDRKLVKEAKRRGWKKVATVAVGDHYDRALLVANKINRKKGVRRRDIEIEVFRAEEVLSIPQIHGNGDEGERIAAEYRRKFEQIQESQPYIELKRHEEKAIFIEKWHLTRIADLTSKIFRPRVMSQ